MLNGDKVYLRRLQASDLPQVLSWINEPEIYSMMGIFGPRTKEEQDEWYKQVCMSKNNIVFAICKKVDDSYIGNVSLFDVNYINRNSGISIFIAERDDRRAGFGIETVKLACEYAFDFLNLNKVYCKTDNEVAAKLYMKLGFIQEGVLRQQAYAFGKYIDKEVYGLLRHEFLPSVNY